jgi:hypothetical protein
VLGGALGEPGRAVMSRTAQAVGPRGSRPAGPSLRRRGDPLRRRGRQVEGRLGSHQERGAGHRGLIDLDLGEHAGQGREQRPEQRLVHEREADPLHEQAARLQAATRQLVELPREEVRGPPSRGEGCDTMARSGGGRAAGRSARRRCAGGRAGRPGGPRAAAARGSGWPTRPPAPARRPGRTGRREGGPRRCPRLPGRPRAASGSPDAGPAAAATSSGPGRSGSAVSPAAGPRTPAGRWS